MSYLYDIRVLGSPTQSDLDEIRLEIEAVLQATTLRLGTEVAYLVNDSVTPPTAIPTAIAYFGSAAHSNQGLQPFIEAGAVIVPIVPAGLAVETAIPRELRKLNCVHLESVQVQTVAHAMLECIGLLPRQRRVFLSYRRAEATEAAIQLFQALSARHFNVFLDTHDILPAVDFQAALWHRLTESDVLIMLDTPSYFSSRWTDAEFGRALAKGIAILRVGWPGVAATRSLGLAVELPLTLADFSSAVGGVNDAAIARICAVVLSTRARSAAVRMENFMEAIRHQAKQVIAAVGNRCSAGSVTIKLASGKDVIVSATTGVPTSQSLHDLEKIAGPADAALVFDAIGLHADALLHIEWLGGHVKNPRWVKVHELAWKLAGWEADSNA